MPDIYLRPVTATNAVFLYDQSADAIVGVITPAVGNFSLSGLGGYDISRWERTAKALWDHEPKRKEHTRPHRWNACRLAHILERQVQRERQRCALQRRDEDELLILDVL